MPESVKVIMVGVSFEMNSKNVSKIYTHIPYGYYIYGWRGAWEGVGFRIEGTHV